MRDRILRTAVLTAPAVTLVTAAAVFDAQFYWLAAAMIAVAVVLYFAASI